MIVVTVARKPCAETTVAQNTLANGCGGYAIDATRVSHDSASLAWVTKWSGHMGHPVGMFGLGGSTSGRWPANLILEHLAGCRNMGVVKVKVPKHRNPSVHVNAFPHGSHQLRPDKAAYDFSDEDGNETVQKWDCDPECPIRVLDEQGGDRPSTLTGRASRFFKQVGQTPEEQE